MTSRSAAILVASMIILVLASSCGGPPPATPPQRLTPTNFDKVQNGMSQLEVEQILGPWSSFSRDATVKINGADTRVLQYHWKRGDKEIIVNFVADKAVSKSSQSLVAQSAEEKAK